MRHAATAPGLQGSHTPRSLAPGARSPDGQTVSRARQTPSRALAPGLAEHRNTEHPRACGPVGCGCGCCWLLACTGRPSASCYNAATARSQLRGRAGPARPHWHLPKPKLSKQKRRPQTTHTTVTRHKTALLLAAAIKSTNYDCRTTYYDSLPYIYNTYMNISRAPGQLIHDARALFLRCGEHPWAAPGAKPSECYVPMPPPRATLPLSAQTRPCILRTGLLPGATH